MNPPTGAASNPASDPVRLWPAALAALGGSTMSGLLPLMAQLVYRDGVGPLSLLFCRFAIGLLTLIAVAGATGLNLAGATRRGAWRLTLIGATLGAGQSFCYFASLETLQTSIAVLLFYTYPVLTAAIERIVFKRPVSPLAALCITAIVAGAALITLPEVHGGTINPRGLLWATLGPLVYSFYLAIAARITRRYPPLIGAAHLYLGFFCTFLAAVLWHGLDLPKSAISWAALVFIATIGGALTITLFSYAAPRLGPTSYAIVATMELVTVIAVGLLVLGEPLSPTRAIGGLMVIAGVAAHGLTRHPAATAPPALAPASSAEG